MPRSQNLWKQLFRQILSNKSSTLMRIHQCYQLPLEDQKPEMLRNGFHGTSCSIKFFEGAYF
ncbi:unnamed protein product, partial [Nezara viridula]